MIEEQVVRPYGENEKEKLQEASVAIFIDALKGAAADVWKAPLINGSASPADQPETGTRGEGGDGSNG
jgi:hypothetical protein